MNKNLLIGVGVIIILIVGYMLISNTQKTAMVPTPMPVASTTTDNTATSSATTSEVMVVLAEQNTSKQLGTAILMEVDGKVKVTLKMTGVPEGVSQPAHIHIGACPEVGAVKYPLTNVVNGMSETTLDTTMAKLKSELPLGINVHKSQAEAKVYVSCGDLKL